MQDSIGLEKEYQQCEDQFEKAKNKSSLILIYILIGLSILGIVIQKMLRKNKPTPIDINPNFKEDISTKEKTLLNGLKEYLENEFEKAVQKSIVDNPDQLIGAMTNCASVNFDFFMCNISFFRL